MHKKELPYSLIVNFNDAEEQGLLGINAYVKNGTWFEDVYTFINLGNFT